MEIFELAAELGKKLKDDARLVALEDAKKAYEESAELKKYMIEYEVQQPKGRAKRGVAVSALQITIDPDAAQTDNHLKWFVPFPGNARKIDVNFFLFG